MTSTPRVLMLNGLTETETVLRAVFEPRGAKVERRRGVAAEDVATPPEVLLLDLDDHPSDDWSDAAWPEVPRVVVGSVPLNDDSRSVRFLEKPFHYPELVRVVQSLLDAPTAQRRVG